jgi:TPR repeat protein
MATKMNHKIIDVLIPWKLPREEGAEAFPSYVKSKLEWQSLFEKAQGGDPEAQWEIADGYGHGYKDEQGNVVVEASSKKAAEWFRKSADSGHASAQNNLGIMLSEGDGVVKDVKHAVELLKRAYKGGESSAANNIAITYRENGNFRRAIHWFKKSADYWGKGVRKNYQKAFDLYQKVVKSKGICEASRDDGNFYLALACLEGKGVTKSVTTAKRLLRRANRDDDHPAARALLQELKRKP